MRVLMYSSSFPPLLCVSTAHTFCVFPSIVCITLHKVVDVFRWKRTSVKLHIEMCNVLVGHFLFSRTANSLFQLVKQKVNTIQFIFLVSFKIVTYLI